MQLTLEPYSAHLQQSITQLILDIQQNEFAIPITLADQPDLVDIPGFYQKKNGNFWVASVDGVIAGTIALLDIGHNQGALRKMFVKKEFRGKEMGVAQQLLDNLLQWAGSHDLQEIFLGTTEKFLAAQRFYEKNGFVEIGKKHLPAAFPVMAVDVKFYVRIRPRSERSVL